MHPLLVAVVDGAIMPRELLYLELIKLEEVAVILSLRGQDAKPSPAFRPSLPRQMDLLLGLPA